MLAVRGNCEAAEDTTEPRRLRTLGGSRAHMVDGTAHEYSSASAEPLSKEEALKRFLARKEAAARDDKPREREGDREGARAKRSSDESVDEDKMPERELKKTKQHLSDDELFPVSKHSHFDLVPGHQNTTTKEPMKRCDAPHDPLGC